MVVLWRYQGAVRRRVVEVGVRVAVELIPGDRDCLCEEAERDGPLDRVLDAVAGLADAVGLASWLQVSIVQRLS